MTISWHYVKCILLKKVLSFGLELKTLMIKRSSILSLLFEHAVSSVSSFIQKGNALFAADIYDLLKNILSFKNVLYPGVMTEILFYGICSFLIL